jgi:hypothetical protein
VPLHRADVVILVVADDHLFKVPLIDFGSNRIGLVS